MLSSCNSFSQEIKKESKQYHAWITTINNEKKHGGYLAEVTDASLTLSARNKDCQSNFNLINVRKIEFRKEGRQKRGMRIGMLVGFIIGGSLGYLDGDTPFLYSTFHKEDKAIFFGFLSSGIGALAGWQIGSAKIKIPLNGNINGQKKAMSKYLITNQ